MNTLLSKYLEASGYKKKLSKTTKSEYYVNSEGVTIRYSDHRGSFEFDINIQEVTNKRNEYLIFIGLGKQPITVTGLKELKEAIKWYSIYKPQIINHLSSKQKYEPVVSKETKQPVTVSKTTPVSKTSLKNITKKASGDFELLSPQWKELLPAGQNLKIFTRCVNSGIELWKQKPSTPGIPVFQSWWTRITTAILGVTKRTMSKTLGPSVRDLFKNELILKFPSFYDLIIFLNKYYCRSWEEIKKAFDFKYDISPSPEKPKQEFKIVGFVDLDKINKPKPQPNPEPKVKEPDEREVLMLSPTKDIKWFSRLELFLMQDIRCYSKLRKNAREFIKTELMTKTYNYKSFVEAVLQGKDQQYSLKTIQKHISEINGGS